MKSIRTSRPAVRAGANSPAESAVSAIVWLLTVLQAHGSQRINQSGKGPP